MSARRLFPRFSLRAPSSLCAALLLAALAACADPPKLKVRGVPNEQTAGASGAAAASDDGSSGGLGIELNGTPQYYRVVRLTNAQWAQSVQDILGLPEPSGLEAELPEPGGGHH